MKKTIQMKLGLIFLFLFANGYLFSQTNVWSFFVDSIPSLSSPRACDLNSDGIKDLVFGGGTDGVFSNNGIMAVNGSTGNLLWKRPARNEVFGSPIFQDISNDGIKDVFIVGRQAQLLAINGSNGSLIWDFFPYNTNPADSGLYNFYNPQFINDVTGDGIMDIVVANGGDHAAPVWDTLRPPGHIMVINSATGQLIAKAVVPDSAETYCSALVADIQGNGTLWVLYGTGGETLGGSFWACQLSDLLNNDLSNSIQLATDTHYGFIAPASIYKTNSNQYNIYIQSYSGKLTKVKGSNFTQHWSYDLPNTESSAEPVIGNFTGNNNPDVFLFLAKGSSSAYTDYYQVLLDGSNGQVVFKDSIGHMQFASGNAVDLNNDGRDEAIVSINYMEGGYWKHRLQSIDFQNNTIQPIVPTRTGVNIGSTPLFEDIDNDSSLDLVYLVKKDSLNPMGWKGVNLYYSELNAVFPNPGIAWGSYLSTKNNGEYHYTSVDCGPGSLISSTSIVHPWCNGTNTGSIVPVANLGSAPYTYVWSNGSIDSSLSNMIAGTYTVQVTDAAGCYEILTVVLNDPYIISFGGIVPPTCPGGMNGQAILNSSGCPCMFSNCAFLWENGITTKPNNALPEGWSSVMITHPNGCVVIDSVFVPNSAPLVSQSIVTNVTCSGNNDGTIQLFSPLATAPVSYSWSNGSILDSISLLVPGNYNVIVTDARPCTDTLQFVILEPDPVTFISQTENTLCANGNEGSVSITALGGNGGFEYYLNNQSNFSGVFSSLIAGSYTINVVDSLGCTTTNQNVLISSPSSLGVLFNTTPESGVGAMDGSIVAHVSGGVPPYTFQWNDPNLETDSILMNVTQGWYTISITDSNLCTWIDSVFMGVVNTISLNENETLLLYPNPTIGDIYSPILIEKAVIKNALGQILFNYENFLHLDLSGFASGIYYIECAINNSIIVRPILKINSQ